MALVLLCSEAFVKAYTNISDNLAGKYILPSLREAQESGLKNILGETLLDKSKTLVSSGDIDTAANAAYKSLLDNCQFYLAYQTIVEVTYKVSYKIGNFGVAKSSDEQMTNASEAEIEKMQYYYESKADRYCLELQNYLRDNRMLYPELSDSQYNKIESNIYSAASCGIHLGGARGKGIAPKFERRIRK